MRHIEMSNSGLYTSIRFELTDLKCSAHDNTIIIHKDEWWELYKEGWLINVITLSKIGNSE